jgi:hypothetical protein
MVQGLSRIWIYSLQVVTPNYLNKVLLTTVCTLITIYLVEISVKSGIKMQEKKMQKKKLSTSVEEFMTSES